MLTVCRAFTKERKSPRKSRAFVVQKGQVQAPVTRCSRGGAGSQKLHGTSAPPRENSLCKLETLHVSCSINGNNKMCVRFWIQSNFEVAYLYFT